MGCCCSQSSRSLFSSDKYVPIERQLNFHLIKIQEFHEILYPLCTKKTISREDLAKAFKEHFISSDLQDQSQSMLNKVLEHPHFKKDNGLNTFNLMTLGYLYARGTYNEMAESVTQIYDENGDGYIYINSVKKLLQSIFLISSFIIPAVYQRTEFEQISQRDENEIGRVVADTIHILFQHEVKLGCEKLKEELAGKLRYLFDSVKVRELFRKSSDQ